MSTWDGGRLCSCSEVQDAWLRSALLVFCHDLDLVLCVPVQAVQNHMLTPVRETDLRFPQRHILLEMGKEPWWEKSIKAFKVMLQCVFFFNNLANLNVYSISLSY